jgi:hypothetical protein
MADSLSERNAKNTENTQEEEIEERELAPQAVR